MDNLHAQISELLEERDRRYRERERAAAKNRTKAGKYGAAYADHMAKIEQNAFALADESMHEAKRRKSE